MSRIVEVSARALSCPTPGGITFAVGRSAKRDMVLVKVVTDDGTVGWGEAHHAKAPSTIAAFVNDALGPMLIGEDAHAIETIWERVYRRFISTHGPGAAAVIGLSGVDMALWDIKGKDLGQPVWRLLGGRNRAIPAYAGGISLGFQPVDELAREIESLMQQGYRFVKLRVGDSMARAFGTILIDRSDKRSIPAVNERIAQALERGERVTFFPEGEIGATRELRPFRAALFESAAQGSWGVRCVALSYATGPGDDSVEEAVVWGQRPFLAQAWRLVLQNRITVRLQVAGEEPRARDRKQLALRCEALVRAELGLPEKLEGAVADAFEG